MHAGGMGQPFSDRHSLLLAALPVLCAPSQGAVAVSWEPHTVWEGVAAHRGMLFKTINLHIFHFKGTVLVKKPEVAETFLLEEYLFSPQNVSQ